MTVASLNIVLVTHAVEDVMESVEIAGPIGELSAIVRQNSMDSIGHSLDQIAQELGCIHLSSFGVKLDEGKLGCSINRHKKIELALSGLDLSDIDVRTSASDVGLSAEGHKGNHPRAEACVCGRQQPQPPPQGSRQSNAVTSARSPNRHSDFV